MSALPEATAARLSRDTGGLGAQAATGDRSSVHSESFVDRLSLRQIVSESNGESIH